MVWVLLCLLTIVFGQNIYAPEVYSTYFYINTNPDLIAAGITTDQKAREHWQTKGLNEGRQACGSFHTQQYLARYPDVSKSCGRSFPCAINHYLGNGLKEGRLGYQEGGAFGRWTISSQNNRGLFLSASTRMAGAVDSLVWNSFEFTNQWDHGRELQVAITNGHGECFNPTEAGASNDGSSDSTTSKLQAITASNRTLLSASLPAFWLAPGQREPNPSPACTIAINKEKLSNFQIHKNIQINTPNHVLFNFSVFVSDPCSMIQIEGPTQYLPIDFNTFYTFNPANSQVLPISRDNGEVPLPLIFTTQDSKYAVGCYGSSKAGWSLDYAKFFFPSEGPISADTSKWSIVFRYFKDIPVGSILEFSSHLCVGTLSDVVTCMKGITQ